MFIRKPARIPLPHVTARVQTHLPVRAPARADLAPMSAAKQVRLFSDKNELNQLEKDRLRKEGYSEEQMKRIDRGMKTWGSMNDIDDGFGMSPVPRESLVELSKRGIKPERVSGAQRPLSQKK